MAGSERPLRIAVLAQGRYSGGSPIGLHLSRALAAHSTVRVFVGRESINLEDWRRSGLDVEIHGRKDSTFASVTGLLWPLPIWRLARRVRAFLPDVMVVPFIHLWTLPLVIWIKAPAVVFVHDPEPHPGLTSRLWHLIDRRIARRAARVVIHSSRFVGPLASNYGLDRSRIVVVPIGPLTNYAAVASGPSADENTSREVLCFGRMEAYKGVDVLLAASARIRQLAPGSRIRLAGQGLDVVVQARARSLGNVIIDDSWVEEGDVPAYFRRASVVVLPYTSGTQSGVIPVAAAFGVPVVASDVGGLAEQLADGRCGVLVPPGDSEALAVAVAALLNDPPRAAALGAALREEYLVRRNWSSVAATVLEACAAAAGRPAVDRMAG